MLVRQLLPALHRCVPGTRHHEAEAELKSNSSAALVNFPAGVFGLSETS